MSGDANVAANLAAVNLAAAKFAIMLNYFYFCLNLSSSCFYSWLNLI